MDDIKDTDSRGVIMIAAFLILAPWLYPLEQWVGLRFWKPWGWLTGISLMAVFTFVIAPAWLIAGLVLFVRSPYRKQALWMSGSGLVGILSFVGAMATAKAVRHPTFQDLAERSKPLVGAIKKFEKENGTPPARLDALVPEYLTSVPGTGIPVCPDYRYSLKSWVEPNLWELSVPCPFGLVNWDQFLYLPEQNYPEKGYGGSLERIGDWAYVHE